MIEQLGCKVPLLHLALLPGIFNRDVPRIYESFDLHAGTIMLMAIITNNHGACIQGSVKNAHWPQKKYWATSMLMAFYACAVTMYISWPEVIV
jgi:hypothetical protein